MADQVQTQKFKGIFQKCEEFVSNKNNSETWYFNASFVLESGGMYRYFQRKEGDSTKKQFNIQRAIHELKFGDKVEIDINFRFSDEGGIYAGLEALKKV